MTDDLAKRLRDHIAVSFDDRGHVFEDEVLCDDAADRIEELEAKLAKAMDVIDWALICWDDHQEHGYNMQGDWVSDARATIAELTGGKDE
jgi:hypothetical protein